MRWLGLLVSVVMDISGVTSSVFFLEIFRSECYYVGYVWNGVDLEIFSSVVVPQFHAERVNRQTTFGGSFTFTDPYETHMLRSG